MCKPGSRSRVLVLASTLALAGTGARAGHRPTTLDGTWEGTVTVRGAKQSLAITFRSEASALAGSVSVPDEYMLDDALQALSRSGASVHFEYPKELKAGAFDGTIDGGHITGSFKGEQYGDALEGTFELWRRVAARPPYHTEEVRFRGGEGMLAGTLFVPAAAGRHAALVFLHGSGPQTRESYLRHFAARFARAGVVALIYDKRGSGASEGTPWMQSTATFGDLADDGLAGVAFLKGRPEIDARRIGMWGLSQGAWLAPIAAAKSADVAFAVILSGGGVTPSEQELYDDDVKLRALGYSDAQVSQAIGLLKLADDFIREDTEERWTKVQEALAEAKKAPWFRYLDKFPVVLPREAWWHGPQLDYDPRPTLAKVRVPLLVVLGEKDDSTPSAETARRIEGALREGGNTDVKITVVPAADHALQVGPDPWLRLRLLGDGGVPPSSGPVQSWDWMRPANGWEDAMVAWVIARRDR